MAEAKLVVIYPMPTDVETFEKLYTEEHLPLAGEKLSGQTKVSITTMRSTPDGSSPPYYKMAEVWFPSLDDLQTWASTPAAAEVVEHAVSISTQTGTQPIMMVSDEVVF